MWTKIIMCALVYGFYKVVRAYLQKNESKKITAEKASDPSGVSETWLRKTKSPYTKKEADFLVLMQDMEDQLAQFRGGSHEIIGQTGERQHFHEEIVCTVDLILSRVFTKEELRPNKIGAAYTEQGAQLCYQWNGMILKAQVTKGTLIILVLMENGLVLDCLAMGPISQPYKLRAMINQRLSKFGKKLSWISKNIPNKSAA